MKKNDKQEIDSKFRYIESRLETINNEVQCLSNGGHKYKIIEIERGWLHDEQYGGEVDAGDPAVKYECCWCGKITTKRCRKLSREEQMAIETLGFKVLNGLRKKDTNKGT